MTTPYRSSLDALRAAGLMPEAVEKNDPLYIWQHVVWEVKGVPVSMQSEMVALYQNIKDTANAAVEEVAALALSERQARETAEKQLAQTEAACETSEAKADEP